MDASPFQIPEYAIVQVQDSKVQKTKAQTP